MPKKTEKQKNRTVENRTGIFDDAAKRKAAQKVLAKAKADEVNKSKTHVWQVSPDGKTKKMVKIITTLLLFFSIIGYSQTDFKYVGFSENDAECHFKVLKDNSDSQIVFAKYKHPLKIEIVKGKTRTKGGETQYILYTFHLKDKTYDVNNVIIMNENGKCSRNSKLKEEGRKIVDGSFIDKMFNLIVLKS